MNIKGMDKNMQCLGGFQFEVGKEYKIETNGRPLELCSDTVFHYCKSLQQVHNFYNCHNEENRYFEIEVLGEEVTDGEKYGSNHIRIVREITGEELNNLKGLNNGNSGLFNNGDRNSGYSNNGDKNTGNWNSGECNSGNRNNGYKNSGERNNGYFNSGNENNGDRNSGDLNSGYRNTGNRNNGYFNSGYRNTGNRNSGDANNGNLNTGNYNNGESNSGTWNSGFRNTGHNNSGNWNTGCFNNGDWNSGIANKCNFSNGIFCNESDMNIRIFNKPSCMSLEEFLKSRYWDAMSEADFNLIKWINYTTKEKISDPEKERVGGYLKIYSMEEAWANWWSDLSEEAKQIIQEIPNFDPEIFRDITGIEV